MSRKLLFKQEHRWCLGLWMISSHFDPWNTDRDWMNRSEVKGGLERGNWQKSCLSTCIPLEQRALNRQGFPDILRFFSPTDTYTYSMHTLTYACMHLLTVWKTEEVWYRPVWKFYELASLPCPTVRLSIPLLSDSEKRQRCHSVLSPRLVPLHSLHCARSEWWIMWQ